MLSAMILAAQVSATNPLTTLSQWPFPSYTLAQASSYDRASKTEGNDAWFANADYGQYLRTEGEGDAKEWVMADLKGPGAVVRFWSANPTGTVRFRFDGEEKPRIEAKLADLLGGKVAPYKPDQAYVAARGWNLYAPIPFQKRLKITVSGNEREAKALYYQIGYRTYPESIQMSKLTWPGQEPSAAKTAMMKPSSGAKAQVIFEGKGQGAITEVRLKPKVNGGVPDWGQAQDRGLGWLRNVVLEAEFDGMTTIRVPVPDFFGCAPTTATYKTLPMEVTPDGTMICRFVMPYQKSARIRLQGAFGGTTSVTATKVSWTDRSMHFHAQWNTDRQGARPFRDLQVLKAQGRGVFVGTGLHVSNPAGEWWGEGDEKIFVDGEPFPSTFGTGTEDYFGYAWCCPEMFAHPYHAQPRVDGPANGGQVSNVRWHILDAIPFKKSLDFRLEAWHWNQDARTTWSTTAYWYARPGGTPPKTIDPTELEPIAAKPGTPLKGVIEGESLRVESKSGGTVEIQEGFWSLSGGKQLWWRDGKPGDTLVLVGPDLKPGTYDVLANMCFAKDYGSARFEMGNWKFGPVDFYSPQLRWNNTELGGGLEHKGGPIRLKITLGASNRKADPARGMVGIDWIEFN